MEKMSWKKALAAVLAAGMIVSSVSGCASSKTASSGTAAAATSSGSSPASQASQAPAEKVKLKFVCSSSGIKDIGTKNLIAGINSMSKTFELDPYVLPGQSVEYTQKVMVSLMAGDEMDVFYTNDQTAPTFAKANAILPLDDLAKANNFDISQNFGNTIRKYNDKTYLLPCTRDVHITFYNKSLFDQAGVAYPDKSTWTWDKYVEDAKKITDAKKGIYGSYMADWGPYFTFSAKQKGISAYKPDGSSNFDDPAWADSMKFFGDLGNVMKVQPDIVTYESKKLQSDGFMTGKYGLFVCGSWALEMLSDQKSYPRTWKAGITIMPRAEANKESALSIMGGYSVCSTTKHKNEAFQAAQMMALNEWKLPQTGRVPDMVNLTKNDQLSAMDTLSKSLTFDGISSQQLYDCILSPDLNLVPEVVIGNGMTSINEMIPKEGIMYGSGQRTLSQTMQEMKQKADKAITDDKSGNK